MDKKMIILGGVARYARKNRDSGRVFSGGGTIGALPAHVAVEQPKVLKRWKRKS